MSPLASNDIKMINNENELDYNSSTSSFFESPSEQISRDGSRGESTNNDTSKYDLFGES